MTRPADSSTPTCRETAAKLIRASWARSVIRNSPARRSTSIDRRDPAKFVHLFEFADEDAHRTHGSSGAVRKFESVYVPVLADGPVRFTDYRLVARNTTA